MPMSRYALPSDPYHNTSWQLGRKLGGFFPTSAESSWKQIRDFSQEFFLCFSLGCFVHSLQVRIFRILWSPWPIGPSERGADRGIESVDRWTCSLISQTSQNSNPHTPLPQPTDAVMEIHAVQQTSGASTFLAQVYQGNLPLMKSWWIRTQAVDLTGLVHNSTPHFQLGKLELVF